MTTGPRGLSPSCACDAVLRGHELHSAAAGGRRRLSTNARTIKSALGFTGARSRPRTLGNRLRSPEQVRRLHDHQRWTNLDPRNQLGDLLRELSRGRPWTPGDDLRRSRRRNGKDWQDDDRVRACGSGEVKMHINAPTNSHRPQSTRSSRCRKGPQQTSRPTRFFPSALLANADDEDRSPGSDIPGEIDGSELQVIAAPR
jgi:hypothetical protein